MNLSAYFKPFDMHRSWVYILSLTVGIWYALYPNFYVFFIFFSSILTYALFNMLQNIFNKKMCMQLICLYISFFIGILLLHYHENLHAQFLQRMRGVSSYSAKIVDIENWQKGRTALTLLLDEPAHGKIKIYLHAEVPLEIGDIIAIKDLPISKLYNKSYELYLKKEGISSSLFTKNLEYTLLHRPKFNLARWFNKQKMRMIKSLNNKMSPATQMIFCSIFLGAKPADPFYGEKIKTKFNRWGISHFLARSGLHLTFIAFIMFLFLRIIPLHITIKKSLILLILMLYSALTFSSISFIRSLITYSLCSVYIIAKKAIHPLHLFFLTLLAVVLNNPYQLFFLDFQLSFGITFLILLFTLTTNKETNIEY